MESHNPRYVLLRDGLNTPSAKIPGRMRPILPSTVRSTSFTWLDVCRTCRNRQIPRVKFSSNSSGRVGAAAVTKSTITLAENRRAGSPTLRDKIQSRAGNIAGHLRNNSHSHSYPTTLSATASSQDITGNMAQYTARKMGAANTLEHRIFIEENGKPVSPFHDIPLYADQAQTILNMIVEVPRWTNAKMEASCLPRRGSCLQSFVTLKRTVVSSSC